MEARPLGGCRWPAAVAAWAPCRVGSRPRRASVEPRREAAGARPTEAVRASQRRGKPGHGRGSRRGPRRRRQQPKQQRRVVGVAANRPSLMRRSGRRGTPLILAGGEVARAATMPVREVAVGAVLG